MSVCTSEEIECDIKYLKYFPILTSSKYNNSYMFKINDATTETFIYYFPFSILIYNGKY